MRIEADRDVCIGAGMCVMTAEEVFDQGDDGIVAILTAEVPPEYAEAAAKHIREEFAKVKDDDAKKLEMEKKYTFTGTDKESGDKLGDLNLAELTGKTVLKTHQFHKRYDDVEEATIEKLVIAGDKATITWKSKDGDKGEPGTNPLIMYKQKGEWKAYMTTPRG